MRVRLKERDVRFLLALLRKEKSKFDRETEDLEEEIKFLERLLPKWRYKFMNQSAYGFYKGFRHIKDRLAYLKRKQRGRWHYSKALHYLTCRYESMLRGKVGRPPNVSSMFDFHVKMLEEEEMVP